MSRIGKWPIKIPTGVDVTFKNRQLIVKGPKGELKQDVLEGIDIEQEDTSVRVICLNQGKRYRALYGLYRSLLNNMIIGVSEGFIRSLLIHGTGYKAKVEGKNLNLAMGYSHPVLLPIPTGIECNVEGDRTIEIKGIDKAELGQFAADIKKVRPIEPYKGKGIMYKGEYVRRKEGKSAK